VLLADTNNRGTGVNMILKKSRIWVGNEGKGGMKLFFFESYLTNKLKNALLLAD